MDDVTAARSAHRLLGPESTGLGLGGRRLSPFVGREPELGLLLERLRGIASGGPGHVVHLMGEPGAGKSRLLLEFRRILATENVNVLEGRCASYAVASPYAAVADVLRRAWALDSADARGVALERVRTALLELDLDPDALAPYLFAALGIDRAPMLDRLSPEALRARTFAALEQVLQAHARPRPLVLLMEDLHWMDRTSEAFVASFVETLPRLACLMVITTRPGQHAPCLERPWVSQLALPPLTLEDSRRIARAVLPGDSERSIVEQVAQRGEGNPFFLEELAWAIRTHARENEVTAVPATVGAALSARMDRLPAALCPMLEIAAVIGREVPVGLLADIAGQPIDVVESGLRDLVAGEFLYEQPGGVYVFKHALTQDVAYARGADAERERLHAAAGAAIEQRHAGRLDEHLDRLAHHFDRTTAHAKAIDYLSRLARRMEASYALGESIDALERAIAHCAHLSPQQEADRHVVTLVSQMAVPLALLGRAVEIEARLRPYQSVIDAENDPSLASRFYLSLAMACDFTGRFRDAEQLATQALEHAERAGDRRTIGQVLVIMAQSSLWTCAYREGASRALRSREYLDEDVGSLWRGMAVWFTTLHLAQLGRLDEALAAAWQTLDLARDAADPRMESYGLCLIGWITGRKGNARDGLERCRPTVELAPDANARMVIRCFLGQLAIAAGELELARNELRHGFEASRDAGFWPFAVWNLSWLSVAELSSGDATQALRLADEALVMADKVDFALGRGLALRGRGLALAAARRTTEATASLRAAFDAFVALGAAYDAALCHLDLARVLADEGTKEAAANHLSAGRSLFAEMGVDLDAVGAHHLSHMPGVDPQKERGDAV